jgi:hypothetical protein
MGVPVNNVLRGFIGSLVLGSALNLIGCANTLPSGNGGDTSLASTASPTSSSAGSQTGSSDMTTSNGSSSLGVAPVPGVALAPLPQFITDEYQLIYGIPARQAVIDYMSNSYTTDVAGTYAIVRDLLKEAPDRKAIVATPQNAALVTAYVNKLYNVVLHRAAMAGDSPSMIIQNYMAGIWSIDQVDAIFLSHPEFAQLSTSKYGLRVYP